MRVGVWHGFAKARRYFWARVDVIVGLIAAILAPDFLMPTSPVEASGSYTRYFAYEYTSQTSQEIAFYNLGNVTHTVTVSIYNPDGTLFGTENVTLRAYEEVSIVAPKATWGLLVAGGDGTPTTDEAYGIVATLDNSFSVIAASDGTSELPGTSKSAINPQGKLYTDSWWGIYNYPDAAKNDYVYIFNPNDTSTTVTFTVVDTDGTQISSATNIAFACGGGWAGKDITGGRVVKGDGDIAGTGAGAIADLDGVGTGGNDIDRLGGLGSRPEPEGGPPSSVRVMVSPSQAVVAGLADL